MIYYFSQYCGLAVYFCALMQLHSTGGPALSESPGWLLPCLAVCATVSRVPGFASTHSLILQEARLTFFFFLIHWGFFCCFFFNLFFGCVGSSLLRSGFLWLRRADVTLPCSVRAYCGGFSCCGARALGTRASVVAAHGLSSCGTWTLECTGFSSCGSRALERRLSSCGARA